MLAFHKQGGSCYEFIGGLVDEHDDIVRARIGLKIFEQRGIERWSDCW
jgi:hypothetical protein